MKIEQLMLTIVRCADKADSGWFQSAAPIVLPIITLILGFLLKMAEDAYRAKGKKQEDLRKTEADRELRKEAYREEQSERLRERELANLLALQPLTFNLVRAYAKHYLADLANYRSTQKWGVDLVGDVSEEYRLALQSVLPIEARLHSRDVAAHLKALRKAMGKGVLTKDKATADALYDEAADLFEVLQSALGEEVRRLESAGTH